MRIKCDKFLQMAVSLISPSELEIAQGVHLLAVRNMRRELDMDHSQRTAAKLQSNSFECLFLTVRHDTRYFQPFDFGLF